MTITAQVIADSISPVGKRLTTFLLRYPRFIHAEELTHRILETLPEVIIYEAIPDGLMYDQDLSRNASSSRAIPVQRMIEDLRRDPAMPVFWGSNKPGMQAGEELTGKDLDTVKQLWINQMMMSIETAKHMIDLGLHKQIANRILEPWAHINVVVTATEWANWFNLRAHPDAQPEIHALALEMFNAMAGSQPVHLKPGEWHLPFITDDERKDAYHGPSQTPEWNMLKSVSAARCARTSYLTHDGRVTSVEEDLALCEKLMSNGTVHASPFEHQATPDEVSGTKKGEPVYRNPELHGNLVGWVQARKQIPNEYTPG